MTTRLWWPLREVLPLAQHAMHATDYRLSTAQVGAGAHSRPALIWQATEQHDTLSSNGLPGWFTEHGALHHTHAHTWTHTGSGMLGRPPQHHPGQGFLPLARRHRRGRPDLIELLRRGTHAGCHWFVLDPTDPAHHYRVCDHRGDVAPPEATWVPATVTVEGGGIGDYPAQVADGYRLLGGMIARFTRDVVEQMAEDLSVLRHGAMPGELPLIGWDDQVAVITTERDDGARTHTIEIDRVYPDPTGTYPIGAGRWTWHAIGDAGPGC